MVNQRIQSSQRNEISHMIPHIVQTACAFRSAITFEVDNRKVNAKSIMGVMALASQKVDHIDICADGTDENEAMRAIAGLLS